MRLHPKSKPTISRPLSDTAESHTGTGRQTDLCGRRLLCHHAAASSTHHTACIIERDDRSGTPQPTGAEHDEQGQVQGQQQHMETAVKKHCLVQQLPVDGPLVLKLAAKVKCPLHVANGICQKKGHRKPHLHSSEAALSLKRKREGGESVGKI